MRRGEGRTAGAIDVARGRAVGSLERALALTMVLLGDYAAVGWIIAAKSLARFKQLEDREFAEYFLVGTLASFLLAVLVGVGIRDRKSTRLNSSHVRTSYAVFCLAKQQ